ncbi:hypothetical protein SNEBB_009590 [Seison nebaliae]|nr:hypothetical protein SNEBB_009590 [Seison nebaliae]
MYKHLSIVTLLLVSSFVLFTSVRCESDDDSMEDLVNFLQKDEAHTFLKRFWSSKSPAQIKKANDIKREKNREKAHKGYEKLCEHAKPGELRACVPLNPLCSIPDA